jgi:hypothetical protein
MVEKPLPACMSIRLFIVVSMFTDYSTANMTAFFNTHHQSEFTAFVPTMDEGTLKTPIL